MGTPGEETGDDWGREDGVVLARVGRRVLPRGFQVVDDPSSSLGEAAGAYRFDDEGVPGQRVELVEEGVVQTLLMSRTPREDIAASKLEAAIADLHKALIVFHGPRDEIVGIENATHIFLPAKHPKSFVSLDDADHLLTRRADAVYVAEVLAACASRYISTGC